MSEHKFHPGDVVVLVRANPSCLPYGRFLGKTGTVLSREVELAVVLFGDVKVDCYTNRLILASKFNPKAKYNDGSKVKVGDTVKRISTGEVGKVKEIGDHSGGYERIVLEWDDLHRDDQHYYANRFELLARDESEQERAPSIPSDQPSTSPDQTIEYGCGEDDFDGVPKWQYYKFRSQKEYEQHLEHRRSWLRGRSS